MAIHNSVQDLNLVWASNGVSTALSPATKYEDGWVVEIPSFQNFNYVLSGLDTNIKQIATHGALPWQANIDYSQYSEVEHNGVIYTNMQANIPAFSGNPESGNFNNDPLGSTLWSQGILKGSFTQTIPLVGQNTVTVLPSHGSVFGEVGLTSDTLWGASCITLSNKNAAIAFNTPNSTYSNWVLANVQGTMVIKDVGNTQSPDNSSMLSTEPNVYELIHSGNVGSIGEVSAIQDTIVKRGASGEASVSWVNVNTDSALNATAVKVLASTGAGQPFVSFPASALGGSGGSGLPPGSVVAFATANAPSGFLHCGGALVSTASFPDLHAAIGIAFGSGAGTFRLPELRGRFIRGLGFDSAAFAVSQEDTYESHRHMSVAPQVNAHTVQSGSGAVVGSTVNSNLVNTTFTGSSETRPKNLTLRYYIKT